MMKRFIGVATAFLMTISFLAPAVYAASEENDTDTVHIGTAEKFAEVARKCTLDEYSQGKTFILDRDIIFVNDDFEPIPSMGGVFDGNGHTVSGITIRNNASYMGIFRYVEKTGTVKDLTVKARVETGGNGTCTGGIAGVNRGSLVNCTFSGTVRGSENTGGIAGLNEGYIASCVTEGVAEGEHTAGGIAGCNSGVIVKCENRAKINNEAEDISIGIDNLAEFSVTNIISPEKLTASTDIGGIAGFSDSTIIQCVNSGSVGYPHSGYNIGGIAGRQSGYISGCENHGTVFGRKDIGGIVGQSEPFLSLFVSAKNADELRSELKILNAQLDSALDDIRRNKDIIGADGDDVTASLDALKDMSHEYLNDLDEIVNDNVSAVNEFSARVSDLISMAEPVTEKISRAADSYQNAVDELTEAERILSDCIGESDEALTMIKPVLDDLDEISSRMKITSDDLSAAIGSLKDFMGSPDELRADIESVDRVINNAINSFNSLSSDAYRLSAEIDKMIENAKSTVDESGTELKQFRENEMGHVRDTLNDLADSARDLADSLRQKQSRLHELSEDLDYSGLTEEDWETVRELITEIADLDPDGRLSDAIDSFSDVLNVISAVITDEALSALGDIEQDISDFLSSADIHHASDPVIINSRMQLSDSVMYENIDLVYDMVDYLDGAVNEAGEMNSPAADIIDRIRSAWDFIEEGDAKLVDAVCMAVKASDSSSVGTSVLREALDLSHDINSYFSQKAELVFIGAGDEIISKRDNIKTLAGDFLDAADKLGESGGDAVEELSADFSSINERLGRISDIIIDMAEDIESTSTDIDDYTEDISEEDSAGQSMGKISSCLNFGSIEGDMNIGGVAGTMGVDNSLDPEDDFQIPQNLTADFLYTEKTVIRSCTNKGIITAKRSDAGGIVGNMETGAVFSSSSFGNISSTDGGYVGGIAGRSSAVLIGSCAYCRLSGSSYVGGIAGSGHDIRDCRSFVSIDGGSEFIGMTAGSADGEQKNNSFVENEDGIGGIDGISYKGKAFPMTYDEFILSGGIPSDFREIELLFAVTDDDGNITDSILSFRTGYGGSISDSDIPEVPAKDGYFGRWEEFEHDDIRFSRIVRAEYEKLILTIASDDSEEAIPDFLAEGQFDDTAVLSAEQNGSQWTVTLPDDGTHIIRYLNKTSRPQLTVNGEIINFETDGKYLVFPQNGKSFTLSETELPDTRLYIAIGAGAAAVIFITIIAAVSAAGKRRKKKNNK